MVFAERPAGGNVYPRNSLHTEVSSYFYYSVCLGIVWWKNSHSPRPALHLETRFICG